jgi:hypothetical protein
VISTVESVRNLGTVEDPPRTRLGVHAVNGLVTAPVGFRQLRRPSTALFVHVRPSYAPRFVPKLGGQWSICSVRTAIRTSSGTPGGTLREGQTRPCQWLMLATRDRASSVPNGQGPGRFAIFE